MIDNVNIFIAEDDAEDRMILLDSLSQLIHPACVRFAEDGIALLDIVSAFAGTGIIHAIILDLNMPKLNGVETLQRLKQNPGLAHIPVIVLSTSINPLQRKECLALGAADYLTKPCTYKEAIDLGIFIRDFVAPPAS